MSMLQIECFVMQGDETNPSTAMVLTFSPCRFSLSYCHTTVASECFVQPLILSSAPLHRAPGIKHPLATSTDRYQPG